MLDVAGHLTSFGWKGQGTALREGAITRPLLVSQKKSLAGLGKDRDEAFPFWDHVFAAAAKTINIKIAKSDDGSDNDNDDPKPTSGAALERTATGILSNRRPTSAISTPESSTPELVLDTSLSKLSVMAVAKREAARRLLYGSFYRAFVIKPELEQTTEDSERKRKRDDNSDYGTTQWRTLAATVTAPASQIKANSDSEEDDISRRRAKLERRAAKAERKAAKAERRAARAEKREKKRLRSERTAAEEMKEERDETVAERSADCDALVWKSKKVKAMDEDSRQKKRRRKASEDS